MKNFEGKNNNMRSKNFDAPKIKLIEFADVLSSLSSEERKKLVEGCDTANLVKVFKDSGMMQTIEVFLQNGMNISCTARILYMHRNTLIYKLNSIRKLTGLDLKDFKMAATFKILHALYVLNNEAL